MNNKYSIEIKNAEFGKNGLAVKSGWAIVYNTNPVTHEYTNASYDNVPLGGSIVAGTYLDAPELPTKPNIAIVRSEDGKSWIHVADYRGQTAFLIENGQPIEINLIGELPPDLTLLPPQTEFDKWDGRKWVTDTEEKKAALVAQSDQEKIRLLEEANVTITYLQDAIEVGLDDADYKAKLTEWKTYRVLLNRIDTSLAPDINWPQKP